MDTRVILLLGLLLCGCVTPYGPRGYAGGYRERPTGPGEWWLDVNGNGFTSASTLKAYFHQRATELCGGEYRTELFGQQTATHQYGQAKNVDKSSVSGRVICGSATASADAG